MKTHKKSHVSEVVHKPKIVDEFIPHLLPSKIASIMQPTATARSRHSVTFAPTVDSRLPSPAVYNRDHLFPSSPDTPATIHRDSIPTLVYTTSDTNPTVPLKHSATSDLGRNEMLHQDYYQTFQQKYPGSRSDGEEMQDIVDVSRRGSVCPPTLIVDSQVLNNIQNVGHCLTNGAIWYH